MRSTARGLDLNFTRNPTFSLSACPVLHLDYPPAGPPLSPFPRWPRFQSSHLGLPPSSPSPSQSHITRMLYHSPPPTPFLTPLFFSPPISLRSTKPQCRCRCRCRSQTSFSLALCHSISLSLSVVPPSLPSRPELTAESSAQSQFSAERTRS